MVTMTLSWFRLRAGQASVTGSPELAGYAVDISRRSLFLAAPVAGETGDRKCSKPPYADVNERDYRTVLKLVNGAVKKAWAAPHRDLKALLD